MKQYLCPYQQTFRIEEKNYAMQVLAERWAPSTRLVNPLQSNYIIWRNPDSNPSSLMHKNTALWSPTSMATVYTGHPGCLALSKGCMNWAINQSPMAPESSDRLTTSRGRSFGSGNNTISQPPNFGLGNRVVWGPRRKYTSRWLPTTWRWGIEKIAHAMNHTLRLFSTPLSPSLLHPSNDGWSVYRFVQNILCI